MSADRTLQLLAACRAFPDATETQPWGEGETAFKVGGRTFAFVSHGRGRLAVSAKPAPGERDAFLALPGFGPAPYVGRFGWLRIGVDSDESLERARILIGQSYARFAPSRGRGKEGTETGGRGRQAAGSHGR